MAKPRKYIVRATVTISLHQTIWAESAEDALSIAGDLSMPSIHDVESDRRRSDGDDADTWSTSGELDGEAKDLEAELCK